MDADGLTNDESGAVVAAARRAAERYPWYANRLAETGFWAAPDLAHVPILREAELANTYYEAAEETGPGTTYLTSGTSTGARKQVRWAPEDHSRYVTHRATLFHRFIAGSCRSACADLGTGHAAASALKIFTRLGLRGGEIDFSWPLARHVDTLRTSQPDLLYTMPMILERVVAAGGPGYVPRRVIVVGDLAPAEWRAAISRRIGLDPVHMLDVFGSIEVGAIAYSEPSIDAYLFHDHIVPELVGDDPGDCRDGPETGLLALTSLERDSFPAIRYVSGDVVSGLRRYRVGEQDAWGYERHVGREGEERKHGEMLSVHSIAAALLEIAPGAAWDVRREGLEVVVELEAAAWSDGVAAAIRGRIRESNPDADQMIRSGLIGDIGVVPRSFVDVATKRGASKEA